MTEKEAITYLQAEGFDRFYIEERPSKIIMCGQAGTRRAKQYRFEDGKLYEHVGYDGFEDKWSEQAIILDKLDNAVDPEANMTLKNSEKR